MQGQLKTRVLYVVGWFRNKLSISVIPVVQIAGHCFHPLWVKNQVIYLCPIHQPFHMIRIMCYKSCAKVAQAKCQEKLNSVKISIVCIIPFLLVRVLFWGGVNYAGWLILPRFCEVTSHSLYTFKSLFIALRSRNLHIQTCIFNQWKLSY